MRGPQKPSSEPRDLEGEGGAIGAVPERLRSGHGGCESGRGVGGYWRLEMRLGLVLGYGNAFGVESRPEWEGTWLSNSHPHCLPPLRAALPIGSRIFSGAFGTNRLRAKIFFGASKITAPLLGGGGGTPDRSEAGC